ncbi:hypothetical protein COS81_03955 [candidate division WWE3 bacterium CG06_land_8_20_14_3_00_42_16]|uniref:DUF3048 domain-containing protein n=3 Tax=Katanobacteria TaxID=422282 RepID=A0A2M7AM34_UNCKA|nr:MAG: hypothetical protein COS81_03955 [candidate division WWE3 bacterium CG06_land_8_20_14_3_00_42_16]PJA37767.1 MAG: hypothetical protein CO181_02140 [candidate division WWE3 bacterium CG_4_9_14_3_um_filter_43_9]PJC68606.1 MAG: hypothetical protein CO015_03435 [candidate division WWE3 bacterium CG_4_8_14_3_um_filter_42_11]
MWHFVHKRRNFSKKFMAKWSYLGIKPKKKMFNSVKSWFVNLRVWEKTVLILVGLAALGLIIYFLLKGLGFGKWSETASSTNIFQESSSSAEASSSVEVAKKDKVNPLDGVLVTQAEYNKITSRSVLAVVFDNHFDARPQAGLNKADLVYEVLAEGGITRFLAFYSKEDAEEVGSVRSARIYFLDWVSEFNALFAHVGGASLAGPTNALGKIVEYGIRDLDQFSLGSPTYWRGTDKIAPHNVYSTIQKLWDEATREGFNQFDKFDIWQFEDELPKEERALKQEVSFSFGAGGDSLYDVKWVYQPQENVYNRYNGGIEQKDKNSGKTINTKNVAIEFVNQYSSGDSSGHLIIETVGEGRALIFKDGQVEEGTWKKESRLGRTKFYDSLGGEIQFNRGRTWIEALPNGTAISY